MSKWLRDVVLIPLVIALVTGFAFMVWGAWYSGVKWHSPLSTAWLKAILNAPYPLWVTMVAMMFAVGFGWVVVVLRGAWKKANEQIKKFAQREVELLHEVAMSDVHREEADRLRTRVKELERPEPKLHGVWNNSQTFWHLGRKGEEPMMQIGGWIDLTSSNTKDMIYLLAAYINEQRSDISMDVAVKPNTVNHDMVMLYMVPPLETDASKPFTATVVVEDQYNRKYELPIHTFRATTGQAQMPVPTKLAPQLHAAWRSSGWCWVMHDGERVLRISGDGAFVLDNVREPVIFTGVRVERGEYVGTFDNFELKPSEPHFRGLHVDFKGQSPEDRENITAKLTFVDLRGNEYPTPEVTFKPLAEPERFGGLRWPKE